MFSNIQFMLKPLCCFLLLLFYILIEYDLPYPHSLASRKCGIIRFMDGLMLVYFVQQMLVIYHYCYMYVNLHGFVGGHSTDHHEEIPE